MMERHQDDLLDPPPPPPRLPQCARLDRIKLAERTSRINRASPLAGQGRSGPLALKAARGVGPNNPT
jgi:hypothetical protein